MRNITFLFALFLTWLPFCSCKTGYNEIQDTSEGSRITLVIKDYCDHYKDDLNKYSIFSLVNESSVDGSFYSYSILPMVSNYNYTIHIDESKSYLPGGYIEYNGMTFFLNEKKGNKAEKNLLEYLHSRKLLDSTMIKVEMGLIKPEDITPVLQLTDDSKEATYYVICKDSPSKIKRRIRSNRVLNLSDKKFINLCD